MEIVIWPCIAHKIAQTNANIQISGSHFNPNMDVITSIIKCGMELCIHSKKILEWISNFILYFITGHVITYPC